MTESEIIRVACNLGTSEQEEYLLQVCGDDRQLYQRVRALLEANSNLDTISDMNNGELAQPRKAGEVAQDEVAQTFQHSHEPHTDSSRSLGLRHGDEIGPFKLLQPLGRGGMGEVWMAEQYLPVKRQVALKVIKQGIGSKEVLARFDAERQALALMNHPNIARILDAGTTPDGQPYFAMELVQGKPLTTYCDENELTVNERLELFRDACNGVQHAHQKGIIHRDLKPGNILVAVYDGKPVAKVIDFGLAKAMENTLKLTDQSLFTGIGQILGTLKYMSPEQASLDAVDIDTRTDIYSLGVILYELLTGTTPLDDSSIKDMAALKVLEFVRNKEPVKPSSRLSSSSDEQVSTITGNRKTDSIRLKRVLIGDLDWVVMKALDKDRSRRYESASGFSADVLRYLRSEPVIARPPSLNYRVKKFVRKNRIGVLSASLVVLALVGGIIGTTIGLFRAIAAEKLAESRREEAEKNLSYAKKGNAILGSVFARLDPTANYTNVADLRNALRDNLQSAVEQLNGSAIGDPLAVTEMQMTLAQSLISLEETVLAIELLEKVRETRVNLLGIEHSDTLKSMNRLALGYLRGGKLDQAISLYEQTLDLAKLHLGLDHSGTLNTMGDFASALISCGQLEKALPLMEESAKRIASKNGPDHTDTLSATNNLATAYMESGRIDKALPLFEQIADSRKSKLGPNHPHTLESMGNLAWAQIDSGQLENAVELFKQTLDLQLSTIGADNPSTMYTMSGLAATYEELGQPEKAIPLYERALDVMKVKLGSDHPDTLSAMCNLAGSLYRAGQMDRTVQVYEQATELMKAKLGLDHPNTLLTINNLALAYKDSDQFEKALPLFEKALEGMENLHFKSQFSFKIFPSTIEALEAAKQYDQADAWREKWQTFIKEEFGEESIPFAAELETHALAQLERKTPAKAEQILERCLTIRKKLQSNSWTMFKTQSLLGTSLLDQKKFNDAESKLLASYEGLKTQESTTPREAALAIRETLDRLVELYSVLEQPEKIDRYRELQDAYRPH